MAGVLISLIEPAGNVSAGVPATAARVAQEKAASSTVVAPRLRCSRNHLRVGLDQRADGSQLDVAGAGRFARIDHERLTVARAGGGGV